MNGGTFSDINYRDKATQIAEASNYLQHTVGYSKEQADYTASVTINNVPTDQLYTGEKALSLAYGVVIENVKLGSGDDYVYDNKYNNIISGGDGNDTFYMGAGGYDQVDGGNGIDTVVLPVNKSAVTIGRTANEVYLINDKFSIKLVGVEDVQFADQLYIV
jgi:Ca2+-binding RTX toxin-like protein